MIILNYCNHFLKSLFRNVQIKYPGSHRKVQRQHFQLRHPPRPQNSMSALMTTILGNNNKGHIFLLPCIILLLFMSLLTHYIWRSSSEAFKAEAPLDHTHTHTHTIPTPSQPSASSILLPTLLSPEMHD